ncbi:hypothetical protein J6590_020026 [Homalodisca vitripennis]|nr:hypothetical protein J6590_020026 [Homalodisca vitripennis]
MPRKILSNLSNLCFRKKSVTEGNQAIPILPNRGVIFLRKRTKNPRREASQRRKNNRNQNRSELRSLSAACTEFVRNFRDLSVLLGSARLCPHSFSPPRLITPFNLRREELVALRTTTCCKARAGRRRDDGDGVSLRLRRFLATFGDSVATSRRVVRNAEQLVG